MSFLFKPTGGDCMGVAQQLAFAEHLVYVAPRGDAEFAIDATGIAGEGFPSPKTCVIHESWRGELSSELNAIEGSTRLVYFAKRAGLIMGNPGPHSEKVGVLVWYRRGVPVPPTFLILQDEMHLAGGWGVPAPPSALAVQVASPGKAYNLTHGRIVEHLELDKYTGPLLAWHRIGARGPVFRFFETHLGGLPVHASLELLDVPLEEFLQFIYGGADLTPPFFKDQIGAAVRVTVPPWPSWSEYGFQPEVRLPPEPWVWPLDLRRDQEGALWVDGKTFVVADVTATGPDPKAAAGQALWLARNVRVDGAQVRCDALKDTPHRLKVLSQKGYRN